MRSEHNGFEPRDTVRVPIEEIHQLTKLGSVICQACGTKLRDGALVTACAWAVRPDNPWQVGQTRFGDHPLRLTRHATLGVHECIPSGRIARIVNQAHQRSYPIILDPHITARAPPEEAAA